MNPTPLGPGPLVYAHRGDRTRAPDNTIEAYLLAVEAGAHGIELDVRRTRDGFLILHHDDRDTSIGVFSEMDFDELRSRAPHIPTLREAMDAIPSHVFINVEVKNELGESGFDPSRGLVAQTIAEIEDNDDPTRILLSSFDPVAMQRAGDIGPSFLCGLLTMPPVPLETAVTLALGHDMDAVNPQFVYLQDDVEGGIATLKDRGLSVVVWDVNTEDEVAQVARSGADVIITDDPGMARRTIDQR